jgi:hypothetical protein
LLSVKGNQPRLRHQLAELPWRDVEPAHRSAQTVHGRREIRTLKVVTIATGIVFPRAAQAIQVTRKTRPNRAATSTGKRARWRTETRLRNHRPAPAPGSARRARRLDPRAVANRERPALGPRRDLRRRPLTGPYRRRPTGHGLFPEPRDQSAPARRGHQHRRRPTASRPRRHPPPPTAHDHMTLPRPCQRTHRGDQPTD